MAYLTQEEIKLYDALVREYTDWTSPFIRENYNEVVNEGKYENDKIIPSLVNSFKLNIVSYFNSTYGAKSTSEEFDKLYKSFKKKDPVIRKVLESKKPSQLSLNEYVKYTDLIEVAYNLARKKGILSSIFRQLVTMLIMSLSFLIVFVICTPIYIAEAIGYVVNIKDIMHKLFGATTKLVNFQSKSKTVSESMALTGLTVGGGVLLVTQIIPILKECIYYFYYLRIKASDSVEYLSDALEYNALEVQKNKDVKNADKIAIKQKKIADKLKSLSSKLEFSESASKQAKSRVEKENTKISNDEIIKHKELYDLELDSFGI